jgi:type I restriction enzyme S subunit
MKTASVPIGDVAEFINGVAFGPDDWHSEGRKIIRIQNLTGASKGYNRTRCEVDERNLVRRGDLLVSWSATLGVFVWDDEEACVNQHIFKVIPKESHVDRAYLKHALRSSLATMERQVHGATMKHITRPRFLEVEIPLPDIPEQKRIAATLDKADIIRLKRQQSLKLLDELFRSVFLDMFGDPVTNPKRWEPSTLGELASVERGRFSPRPRNDPSFYNGEYPFIQTGDIADADGQVKTWRQTLNERGIRVSKSFCKGTVVIAIVGATIGRTAILGFDSYCPDSVVGIQPYDEKATALYLEHVLRMRRKELLRRASHTARANVNLEILRPFPILKPPFSLQQRFSEIILKVGEQKSRQREALLETSHMFYALQANAFNL